MEMTAHPISGYLLSHNALYGSYWCSAGTFSRVDNMSLPSAL